MDSCYYCSYKIMNICIDTSGNSEELKPETKAVISASAKVQLDTDTLELGSKEVHEILEAKGTYIYIRQFYYYNQECQKCRGKLLEQGLLLL